MAQVEIERAYRIVGALEKTVREIENKVVPTLNSAISRWKKRTLWADGIVFGLILVLFLAITIGNGHWEGFQLTAGWWQWLTATPVRSTFFLGFLLVAAAGIHIGLRNLTASTLRGWLGKKQQDLATKLDLNSAFEKNVKPWRSIFARRPAGWGRSSRKALAALLHKTDEYVQDLNDRFTNPSGGKIDDIPHLHPLTSETAKAVSEETTDTESATENDFSSKQF